jgi:hypothetical protein
MSTDQTAWASGWRWFHGTTQTGRELSDVVCPFCAGSRDPRDQPWDVGCYTCDWSYMGNDFIPGDELITDGRLAVDMGRLHRCEPEIWVMDPDQHTHHLGELDSDGKLRKTKENNGQEARHST